ncbi:MAG: hypothetical protein LBF97_00610, partial [Elusimicrobiota bacterium]|nr:hypothetical protein [Elusimicrobiota bacterium]
MNKIIIIEKFNLIKNKNIYILAVILALFSVNLVFSNDNNIEIFDKTENLTREQILEKISIIKDIEKENKIKSKRLKKELKEEKKKLKRLKLDNKDFENENKEITDYIVNENIARDDIELSPEKTSLEEVVTDIWSYDENFLYSNNDLETVPEKKIILESSLIDNKKLKSDNGLFLIYDIFIDENFLINQNDITFLALEKSLLKNYNDIQPIFNNAKDFSIYLNLKGPFLDFLLIQKSIIKNQYKESKENRENNKILKNWQLLNRAIDDKLTIEDKAYILERIRFIPDNKIINENKKINTMYTSLKKLDYEILKSTDLSLIEQYIKNFEKYTDFFEKLLFIQNLIWLDDYSLKDDKLNEILNNDDYEITKKDLTYIINFKKEKLETAVQFFFNLPEKWSFFVSPYYNAKLDILASNSLNNYLKQYLAENIDMVNDASWQVAKSYKSLNNFYLNTEAKHLNHRFPVGIVTDLDFIDKNILKVLAVRDYEIIINKGNFYEYDKAILNGFGKNKKNICLLFENID